jgi:predicted molibdopterin-dependent oxidoreductase YjgC
MTASAQPVALHINGQAIQVVPGTSVAAAMALASMPITRQSVSGQPRTPVCGMGICQECRVTINGRVRLACQTLCAPGMQVERLA